MSVCVSMCRTSGVLFTFECSTPTQHSWFVVGINQIIVPLIPIFILLFWSLFSFQGVTNRSQRSCEQVRDCSLPALFPQQGCHFVLNQQLRGLKTTPLKAVARPSTIRGVYGSRLEFRRLSYVTLPDPTLRC